MTVAMDVGPVVTFSDTERAALASVADQLIPEAHGMPSAGAVITQKRLAFVVTARPDLVAPLHAALSDDLPADAGDRLAALQEEPEILGALLLTVVGAYYTDRDVRERLAYPGQLAITLQSWKVPGYMDEGLIDKVLARGAIWRDPATGRRAVEDRPTALTADGNPA